MAQIDFTITDAEYNQMMVVLDAMRTKLAGLKAPLKRVVASQPAKVKAFATTDEGRFLREVHRVWRDLDTFFDDIRWGED